MISFHRDLVFVNKFPPNRKKDLLNGKSIELVIHSASYSKTKIDPQGVRRHRAVYYTIQKKLIISVSIEDKGLIFLVWLSLAARNLLGCF